MVTGIDLADVSIELARKNFALHGLSGDLYIMNGERLQFNHDSFDVVYAHGVLQYTGDIERMIQEIHRVLESVLAQDITHPGACHLYIHATEPTQEPGKAEGCADYLGASIPGASHIQHMPSHTYNRIGRWGDAVRANTDAWHSDLKAEHGEGFAIYPSHNLHMLLFAASNDGQGAVAIQAGKDYADLMGGANFYEALTMLRFGRFDDIIELRDPPEGTVFRGLWDFGKGYAHLRTGDEGTARWYLHRIKTAIDEDPDNAFRGHTATQLLGVVGSILEGEILRANGDLDGAIAVLRAGGEIEDGLRYDEPEPLNISSYQWLGDVLHCHDSENRQLRPCSEVDQLIRLANRDVTVDERWDLYRQAEREFFTDGGIEPISPLFVRGDYVLRQGWVNYTPAHFGGEQYDTYLVDADVKDLEQNR